MKRNSYRNLRALVSCLGGSAPEILNWDEIIELANKSLTIPSLAAAMGKLEKKVEIPEDVRTYLAAVHDRNTQRNSRLLHQLKEAVTCLNGADIKPVVMKGAAIFSSRAERFQVGRQYLAAPFALLTLLTEIFHYSSWDRFGGNPHPTRLREAKRKFRELRRIFRPVTPGKV